VNDEPDRRRLRPASVPRARWSLNLRSASDEFAARPGLSAVLAALIVLLGVLLVSGRVPVSPNRHSVAGQGWILALGCGVLAAFFANCARLGFGRRGRERRR
jgi:hypothetical protein